MIRTNQQDYDSADDSADDEPMTRLTKRFINGLAKYNLTLDDMIKNNWHYCGGNSGRHFHYFGIVFKHNRGLPEEATSCVCGNHIIQNCYITDGSRTDILILGNCCIKRFIPMASRTCEVCFAKHKNRKVNRCNNCKSGVCIICTNEHDNKRVNMCDHCIDDHCWVCNVYIDDDTKLCDNCTMTQCILCHKPREDVGNDRCNKCIENCCEICNRKHNNTPLKRCDKCMPKYCEICHQEHTNNNMNRCDDHKAGYCITCRKPCQHYKYCYKCNQKRKANYTRYQW